MVTEREREKNGTTQYRQWKEEHRQPQKEDAPVCFEKSGEKEKNRMKMKNLLTLDKVRLIFHSSQKYKYPAFAPSSYARHPIISMTP